MRPALILAVLLATVSVAIVAVCQSSDVTRLRYRVWEAERRRDSLERQLREAEAALSARATPRHLLEMEDRLSVVSSGDGALIPWREPPPPAEPVIVQVDRSSEPPLPPLPARPGAPEPAPSLEEGQ